MLQAATNLTGKFLIAMPGMEDNRFERTVIFMCSHDESGAMGLVINEEFVGLDFNSLLDQLDIDLDTAVQDVPVYAGGPVEPGRGFVLHSVDFMQESTMAINESHALTATIDILTAIAEGEGPQKFLVALGYAGWGGGQLESELQENAWLVTDSADEIIFNTSFDQKWARSIAMMGIDISMLSSDMGHA